MYSVEVYNAVRRFVFIEGHSRREAARRFGISRETARKICQYSEPPGYRRSGPPKRPKLDPFRGIIDQILADDLQVHGKQHHTAKRIYDRLRDEHGFDGGYTTVKDYVRGARVRVREMFVPLLHPPGHAQVDFGEAIGIIDGVKRKIHFFCFDLPQSDACFVKAYPAEMTEAFLDGHVSAFAFFGGVPQSILYDNTRIAVAKILGDGTRQRTKAFTALQSHYLFTDRFGRPGKGNDKGKVEGLVKFARRNFMVPLPRATDFDALNDHLRSCCQRRQKDKAGRQNETIGERLVRDTATLRSLPPAPFEACETRPAKASSTSLVRYRGNDYSVPTTYGHQDVVVKGFVDELGYVPLSPTGAELLFETFSQRYERGSIIVTSNLPFDEWTSVFGNERLTGALLDRLTHHVHILEMNGESYRLKSSKTKRRQTKKTTKTKADSIDPKTGEITTA
jgi:transposase